VNRARSGSEIWIVLGLSLGQSAVYALVSLLAKLTRGPLRESTATLNGSRSDIEWLDFTLQALSIGFALVPVALALYLLGPGAARHLTGETRRLHDTLIGVALAALIGLPGLGLYALGRELGVTAEVIPAPEQAYWWTVPVLLLSAVSNALVEEVIAVGYLMTRLRERGWQWSAIVASASLRGTYHLYQGFGPAVGNFAMGLIFGWLYQRTGRLLPLVIAHVLLDVVAFVGYLWFADDLGLSPRPAGR
jgi:membrane protease YdiL (CAAX protease family)